MNKQNSFVKILLFICGLVFGMQAQVTNPTSDLQSIRGRTDDARINQIISLADTLFKEGESNIQEKKFPQAWRKFDKSVEVILLSGIDVKTVPKLRDYYFQLIDHIYKLEMAAKKKSTQSEKFNFAISPKCLESVFVAPFQSADNYDLLSEDFAYVLSEVLTAPNLCAVSNEDREKILENFGFDTNETFTLATAIKFAIVSKSSLLIVGQYEIISDNILATTKIIKINEGRFLSEEFPDGRRITRDIILTGSPSNLRILQGQIAYQILYQYDKKAIPYSQNQFIEVTPKIKIPASLNIGNSSDDKIDFSIKNSLKKTTCDEIVLKNLQLRNFRLGITFDEATKLLPKATVKNVNLYEKEMYQNFPTATLKDLRFKEIHLIVLNFFDNRLYSIGVVYDDNIKWQNIDEFASQVEKSLNLPAMKRGGYKFDGKYLYCGNYQIKVMLANHKIPAIHLFDVTVFDKIIQRMQEEKNKILKQKIEEEKRKKQIEEEKKRVFKP
jgi:hypothetical protein